MNKKYKISADKLEKILESSWGCIASDKITVEGNKVGYMYREEPDESYDSGWRFFSGTETQEYADEAENFSYYKLNTIVNYDREILPYLAMPVGTALERNSETQVFTIVEEDNDLDT